MNYETMKSFILFVLVGISLLLSFILWSYQPNYDYLNDASYVNEVDVGGQEKTKNELIEPTKIVFKNNEQINGFKDPHDMQVFYRDMASWVLYDYEITEAKNLPKSDQYAEVIFPNLIPAELITNLFTFNDEITLTDWSFDHVYMIPDGHDQSIDVYILSKDGKRLLTASIDKTETYQLLMEYLDVDHGDLQEYMTYETEDTKIYLPKGEVTVSKKTVISSAIDPDDFINALFSKPSLVTPNIREAYFTDGQRGMRIIQDNLRLEFINPIQSNYQKLSALELIEKSVSNINEHKGWTNSFIFDGINSSANNIQYRMLYDGYPVYDHNKISIIQQEWRDQELYRYSRPLIQVGSVLNSEDVELASGEDIIELLESNQLNFKTDNIRDIQVGYYLNLIDDARSLTLKPEWFILYKNDWLRFNVDEYLDGMQEG